MRKQCAAALLTAAFLFAVPVSAQEYEANGVTATVESGQAVVCKTFEVPVGTNTDGLKEPDFSYEGSVYTFSDIAREEIPGKTESKTVELYRTEGVDSEDVQTAARALPASFAYTEDGFTGRVYLDEGSIVITRNTAAVFCNTGFVWVSDNGGAAEVEETLYTAKVKYTGTLTRQGENMLRVTLTYAKVMPTQQEKVMAMLRKAKPYWPYIAAGTAVLLILLGAGIVAAKTRKRRHEHTLPQEIEGIYDEGETIPAQRIAGAMHRPECLGNLDRFDTDTLNNGE